MDKNAIYLEVIKFAKAAVEDEIRALEQHRGRIHNLNTSKISPNIYAKIRFIKRFHLWYSNKELEISDITNERKIENLRVDLQKLIDLSNDIITIISDGSKTQSQKDADVLSKVEPFFTKYGNVYEGTGKTVDVKHGESQFNKIMSRTNKYKKMEPKIKALEEKINLYNAKRAARGLKQNDQQMALANKLQKMKNKQKKEISKQKVVMLKRQAIVEIRNKKIAELSAKSFIASSSGKANKAASLDKKVEKLKNKKIRQPRGNTILFTEFMMAFATKRKYDKLGNLEKRNWADRRLEELREKSTKKF